MLLSGGLHLGNCFRLITEVNDVCRVDAEREHWRNHEMPGLEWRLQARDASLWKAFQELWEVFHLLGAGPGWS